MVRMGVRLDVATTLSGSKNTVKSSWDEVTSSLNTGHAAMPAPLLHTVCKDGTGIMRTTSL